MPKALSALNNRVWYVQGGVHPSRSPVLLTLGKVSTDPTKPIGEAARITAPDPRNFNRDVTVGQVVGSEDRATVSIAARYTEEKAILMEWKNLRCRVDIFLVSGVCGDPQNFSEGGTKWTYFEDGAISSHSGENFGAYGQDENNPSNEMVDMTADDYWELLNMGQDRIGSSVTTRRIYTVDVYTGDPCENCPDPCDRILAVMAGASATPGTQPSLLYSEDGGESWSTQTIDTLFSNEDVVDGAVIGGDIVYISNTGNEMHWTSIERLYAGNNEWGQTDTGFVGGSEPNAMSSVDSRHTWIAGNSGYIYFVKNHKVEAEVQDPGTATSQHLKGVHALSTEFVLVVGNSNAVVYTENGGVNWKAVTGPSVGVNLESCWMWDEDTWFVGEGSGGSGKLWLTTNRGQTWSEAKVPSTYSRIRKIVFISDAEGYLIADAGGQSVVLRTITAGNEWVALPSGKTAVPLDNSYLTDLAVCSRTANTAYAAGLADDASAGILMKMAD